MQIRTLALALGLASATLSASAVPIATESFDYPAGGLGTANGGSGWTTAWAPGSSNVTSPGLTRGGVSASGNALTTLNDNNGAFRTLSSQGTDGTTVWMGYLANGNGTAVAAGYAGLSLFQDGAENLFTGKRSGVALWGLQRSGGASGDSAVPTTDTTTRFLVFKIEFGAGTTAGNERVTMYVDPTPGLATPDVAAAVTLADVTNFSFNRVRIQSGNGSAWAADEVRLATTFAEVPEPATAGVLAVAAGALLARRRRVSGR